MSLLFLSLKGSEELSEANDVLHVYNRKVRLT